MTPGAPILSSIGSYMDKGEQNLDTTGHLAHFANTSSNLDQFQIQEKSEKTETVDKSSNHNSNSGKLSPLTNAKRGIDWAEKQSNERSLKKLLSPTSPTMKQNTDRRISDSQYRSEVDDPFVLMDAKIKE